MGFFDRFTSKKPAAPTPAAQPAPAPAAAPAPAPEKPVAAGGVLPQLAAARTKLAERDLPGALAIYDQVLAVAGERPDVLLSISADLGIHGYIREVIELVAPRYDAERHGPGPGLNLLQAYLATRQPEAAQHLLDLLFSLGRPELEERLIGFSRALAELNVSEHAIAEQAVTPEDEGRIGLASISKPVWYYGLEGRADHLLCRPTAGARRVAFAQCALLGQANAMELAKQPEDPHGRFTRGWALWMSETFQASAGYEAFAGVGTSSAKHFALFPAEWSADNIRQLNESTANGLDYVVTSALRARNADYELVARIWEVKKFRELKAFTIRWTPANANEVLAQFHQQLRTYMEWTALPAGEGLAYSAPAMPLPYVLALGGSLGLFLAEKGVIAPEHANAGADLFLRAAQTNPDDARAQLTLVTGLQRLRARGAAIDETALAHARAWLATDAAKAAGVAGIEV
jgi:hypothetical protein